MEEPRYNESRLRLTASGFQRLLQSPTFPRDKKRYALYGHIASMGETVLNKKTVCRILERKEPVTFYSLEILFEKFHLYPEPGSDYEPFPVSASAAHKHYFVPLERSKCFTGRKQELDTLHALLSKHNLVVISGLGGIGKTQTALAYCSLHQQDYDYVFWLKVEADTDVQQGYVEIARHLKLPGTALGEHEQAAAAMRWLENHSRWLLVLDNLDNPEKGKNYLPRNPSGHILVTSRVSQVDFITTNAPFSLGTLSPQDSLSFFLNRCQIEAPSPQERDAASELAELLGHLPLAMEQAAAYIAHMTTFTNYLALYKKRKLAQLQKSVPASERFPTTVSTTWDINFQAIEEEALHTQNAGKHAPDLLRFSAFLAPDDIPIEIVKMGSQEFCPALFKLFAEAEEDAETEEIYNEVLEPLTRYSLSAKNLSARTFRLHRLVQMVTQERLSDLERNSWKERAVRAVHGAFPVAKFENWPLCARLLPHAIAVSEMIFRDQVKNEAAGYLLDHVGSYLFECGRFPLAASYFVAALKIQREIYPGDHPQIAVSTINLGRLRHSQRFFEEAEDCYKQALDMRRRIFDDTCIEIAECLNNLAGLYDHQGRYEDALPLYQQAIEMTQQFLPQENQHFATLLNNIGLLYYRQKRDPESESHYLQSLEIWRDSGFLNHPLRATCLHNLAQLYRRQCRVIEAEPLYLEALSIQLQVYPDGHPDAAITHHNLALLYEQLKRSQEAAHHFQQMLAIDCKALSEDHPEVAADRKTLEEFYERQSHTNQLG